MPGQPSLLRHSVNQAQSGIMTLVEEWIAVVAELLEECRTIIAILQGKNLNDPVIRSAEDPSARAAC